MIRMVNAVYEINVKSLIRSVTEYSSIDEMNEIMVIGNIHIPHEVNLDVHILMLLNKAMNTV